MRRCKIKVSTETSSVLLNANLYKVVNNIRLATDNYTGPWIERNGYIKYKYNKNLIMLIMSIQHALTLQIANDSFLPC